MTNINLSKQLQNEFSLKICYVQLNSAIRYTKTGELFIF